MDGLLQEHAADAQADFKSEASSDHQDVSKKEQELS